MAEQWLSIVEYARQFNMSDMTVRRRIKTGKINAVLREGKYYIPMSEALRKMSHAQASAPTTPAKPAFARQEPIKPRPIADTQYNHPVSNAPAPAQQNYAPMYAMPHQPSEAQAHHHLIPHQLRNSLNPNTTQALDGSSLIAFCEGALKKSSEAEHRLEALYKETISKLEAEIKARDQHIKLLSQQVEDLQLLTKILERKK